MIPGWRQTSMRRNKVGAQCACGRIVNARDEGELLERLETHFRSCPAQPAENDETAAAVTEEPECRARTLPPPPVEGNHG